MHGTAKPKNNRSPLQSSTSWPSNADATVWTKRLVASRVRDKFYDEAEVSAAMKNPKIQIKIALGLGKGRDRVLTCDLTKEYVAINGDYRS